CAPEVCDGTHALCPGECITSADCSTTAWCQNALCVDKLERGKPCLTNEACASGKCVDGFCCNGACAGQCEACDVAGGEGTCVPISGKPHGQTRPACASNDACGAIACDGSNRSSCSAYAGTDVPCREPSCADGVATLAGSCDGSGQCSAEVKKKC